MVPAGRVAVSRWTYTRAETISILTLIVTFLGVAVAVLNPLGVLDKVKRLSDHGEVTPLAPSSYCISRGLDQSRSDHLIVPIQWRNDRGEQAVIDRPYLIVQGSDSFGFETEPVKFDLVGLSSNANPKSIENGYDPQTSLTLPAESTSPHVLIFRPENDQFYEAHDPHYAYRLDKPFPNVPNDSWDITIGYKRSYGEETSDIGPESIFSMSSPPGLDKLGEDGQPHEECWASDTSKEQSSQSAQ